MLYSALIFDQETQAGFYEDYGSERHEHGQRVNAAVNAGLLHRLVDLSAVRRVLDVGCGYGFLLRLLADRFGIEANGVELSRREASRAAALGVNARCGALSESGLPSVAFDLVTSFEVIEHVTDPVPFIAEMASYLSPGGTLVIMTDNFACSTARALGPSFPKWIPHNHVSHFTPETLEAAVEAADLRVVGRLSYTPWELLASRALKHLRSRHSPLETYDPARALAAEMTGSYRLFALRRLVNPVWARLTARPNLSGALMFVSARRQRVKDTTPYRLVM